MNEEAMFALYPATASRPFLTLTTDGRVIIAGDIYDAAIEFWKWVEKLAPPGWSVEREELEERHA